MPTQKLQDYLDQHEIQYVTISHSPAYTAQRIAELTRIPGKELAKTVIVKIDDKFAMAVLPASRRVNLRHHAGVHRCRRSHALQRGQISMSCFLIAKLGAMPPFGNLYDMGVYVAEQLTEDDEIAFNSQVRTPNLSRCRMTDYANLVTPQVVALT